jgi:hypothetical protein
MNFGIFFMSIKPVSHVQVNVEARGRRQVRASSSAIEQGKQQERPHDIHVFFRWRPHRTRVAFAKVKMRAISSVILLAAAVTAKDCKRACDLFERSQQRFLTHEAKISCKKHNISPRPTTEDICLSTFRAVTHSTCMSICDPEHNVIEDVSFPCELT